jgi:hypothetical protein
VAEHIAHGDSFGKCPTTGCGTSYTNVSPILAQTLTNDKLQVKISPNPSVSGIPFTLAVKSRSNEEVKIRVMSMLGQPVYSTKVPLIKRINLEATS